MRTIAFLAAILLGILESASATRGDQIDQENFVAWQNGWVVAYNRQQSFTPTLPILTAIDVGLVPANPQSGSVLLTLEVRQGGHILSTMSQGLAGNYLGEAHFTLPIPTTVKTSEPAYIVLYDSPTCTLGWKYSGDTYAGGESYPFGTSVPDPNFDFFFRTWGEGGKHALTMSAFAISDPNFAGQISKYEMTNVQYCAYLNGALADGLIVVDRDIVYASSDTTHAQPFLALFPTHPSSQIACVDGIFEVRLRDGYSMSDHPVVFVSWYGAQAFCAYYDCRLPTKKEWQAAADYDGSYAYGCGTIVNGHTANFGMVNPMELSSQPYTASVGHYAAYGYGVCDLAGNVWEWTDNQVVCGGSWRESDPSLLAVQNSQSYPPESTCDSIGFRVCRDSEPYSCLVVGPDCTPELLEAKKQGIAHAMEYLVSFTGYDLAPALGPVTFHLQADKSSGPYTPTMTGFWTTDSNGKGHVYLFDLEKTNRSLPFTPENAVTLEDQLLPVHEAMHGWFATRIANYGIEEPFCKLTSFYISGALGQTPDPIAWFSSVFSYPDGLMHDLAMLGMNEAYLGQILNRTGHDAQVKGRILTVSEFADIVTHVLGKDAVPAFIAAGLMSAGGRL
ncbi:MAG: SUMF1/EgtB/PvdO family nonheme iron enzyme [Phycisphaerales bacterium]